MKSDYSHITLVCDRSGSMQSVKNDAEGAVNAFIEKQKAVPGEATLLLVEFDAPVGLSNDEKKVGWYHVVHNGHISETPTYQLFPRGNTALNDAVGRAITETGEFLNGMPEDQKPEHVFVVIQTDGQENSSRDWNLEKLREVIKTQQEEWHWEFVFLGMGPDAFAQGADMGFQNVTRSAHTGPAHAAAYANTSDHMAGVRGGQMKNMAGTNVKVDEDGTVTPDPVTPVET